MTEDVKSFQECLALASQIGGNKHLILGNGFSVSLFPNIFNYKSLSEKITSEKTKSLFEKLETNDFEYVMHKLDAALEVIKLYPDSDDLTSRISDDLSELKSTLISVISSSHPPKPDAITDVQYESCRAFLSNFKGGKMYSFNYDLLLYWVLMHFKDIPDKKIDCDDGFRKADLDEETVTWEIGREINQSLYYIHGAMHIFNNNNGIEKYTWINAGVPLSQQVRNAIDHRKYPIFISEGRTEHKLKRIRENSYLGRAFASLKSIRGSIFIFGHSLRDEDDHVFDFINKGSPAKQIFISTNSGLNTPNGQRIKAKVNRWRQENPSKTYTFYDARSAKIWNGETF